VSSLSRRELGGLVVVVAVTLAGIGLWYVRSLPQPVEVVAEPAGGGPGSSGPAGEASPEAGSLFVHVAGWVRLPGVYELAEGDRVIDAIEAAGGPRKGAFLDALNLAAVLVDGQQVLVPRAGSAGGPGGGTVPTTPGKVNINTASAAELEALPGIGEVIAQRIVDHRTEHGPFPTVEDLLDVSGIGESTLEDIRDLVTV
jgi:competence protein ComEA